MAVDEAQLPETLGLVVTDMAAAWSVRLVYLGDKLGLYRAMAGAGPLSSAELARRTGTGALRPRMVMQPGGQRLRRL